MEREIISCEEKGKWEEKREKKDFIFLSFFYTLLFEIFLHIRKDILSFSFYLYDRYQV